MGHKKVGVPSRRYTNEFKTEAVKLGHSVGMSEASRRLEYRIRVYSIGSGSSALASWDPRRECRRHRDRRKSLRPKWIDCGASWPRQKWTTKS